MTPDQTKHRTAVERTLQWADEAAARGDHGDALAWLDTVEAIGDALPAQYRVKRGEWLASLQSSQAQAA
jgi:hypothetical protein